MDKNIELLKLRYYLIPFGILMFSLLIFQSLYFFLWVFLVLCVIYVLIFWKTKDISFLTILFFMWILSLWSYVYFMETTYDNISEYQKTFTKKEYEVIDKLGQWRYLVKDDFNWEFILKKAAKWYKLWTILKVYWFLNPTALPNENYKDFLEEQFLSRSIKFSKIKAIFKFDYNNYLVMKWIAWTIYSKKEFVVWKQNISFLKQLKQDLTDKIIKIYSGYNDKYKALVLWLLIWDKSLLSKEIYNQFIHSGLVHIIVVSGGNIMFLVIFLSILLFFIPFYPRLVLIWIWVILYSILVGGDSSVIRATIMWLLSLIALFFGRLSDTKRILWLAFILMLIYNPYFLWYDLWFILSFLAIVWILLANKFNIQFNYKKELRELEKLTQKTKSNNVYYFQIHLIYFKNWLVYFFNNYVLPTLGATIAVSPAIILFTWQVNVLSFLSSIFVVPIVPVVMLDNIIILLVSNLSTTLTHILVWISVEIMKWIFYVSWLFGDKYVYFFKL